MSLWTETYLDAARGSGGEVRPPTLAMRPWRLHGCPRPEMSQVARTVRERIFDVRGIMFIRQLGFGILAVIAIAVTFGLQPEEPEPIDTARFDRQVQQALADFDANESRTAGAPQQQVVNGWVHRDLLTIISRQLSASMEEAPVPIPDPTVAYLLLILVLTVGWHGATSAAGKAPALPREPEPVAPAPDSPAVPEPDTEDQPPDDRL